MILKVKTILRERFVDVYRLVFARPRFQKLNLRLFYLALHGLGILNYQNDQVSGERYLIRSWLPKTIAGSTPVFFDVGANVGHYTQMLLRQFPAAFIHAFEPHPANYRSLVANAFPANRAKCHNIALGEASGSLILYDYADHDGSQHASLHEATLTEFYGQTAVATTVSVETLDDIVEREGIDYLDFLKIDTEGHELAVLRGASRMLREGRIGHIQFEFNALQVYSRAFFRDFRKVLSSYDLYRLLPRGLLPLDDNVTATELFGYQNVLAIPKVLR
jgi:FkbM family methyltransferase